MGILPIIKKCSLAFLLVFITLSQISGCGGGGSSGGSSAVISSPAEVDPDPPVVDPDPPVVDPEPDITIAGFEVVGDEEWSDTAVRKVLHTFAYSGHASDAQISTWSDMDPEAAIVEMLTFSYTNEKLSPSEDASSLHAQSLEALQGFWGGDSVENPMRWDKRNSYKTLTTTGYVGQFNLQRTWIQAVNTRGINPFLHKVIFYLTNYQMAINANNATLGLFRSYYDQFMADLTAEKSFTEVISNAAKSAAIAMRYRHRTNIFDSATRRFSGNDDFAREYFQLFFRLQGENEDPDYHEDVTIDNNALLLTGMEVDRINGAYGSSLEKNWWVAPINFTDHNDGLDLSISNSSSHHVDCLEILHNQICGATAAEKIDALSPIVASNQEVMDNLPVFIIETLADDRLTPEKISQIRAEWKSANDNLLSFLRSYAVSTVFHSQGRVKFSTAIQRGLTLHNSVVLDNEEFFIGRFNTNLPEPDMRHQGGEVFFPAHAVFGGQTGPEAAVNSNIFKDVYTAASEWVGTRLSLLFTTYNADDSLNTVLVWNKDWASVIPSNSSNEYVVAEVADWLWQRMIADNLKNFDVMARSQVRALLARGLDFGYLVTELNPDISDDPNTAYSSFDLTSDPRLIAIRDTLAAETIELDSADPSIRREANQRVNFAVGFISGLPYVFAMEGK